ncbi:MAG: hypothetical protein ASARMPRED_009245 [Alectoria sarmentosa]|nr:MAG: hypothetical protein ASARMPRED_009245 [Alectoria sarmentosa]
MTTTTWKTPSSTEISELFQHAAKEVDTFDYLADEDSRKKALTTAQSLVAALQRPEDVVMRYAWENGSQRMSLRLGVDLGIFHILVDNNGKPVSATEIAAQSKAEELLIIRIMRVLTAVGFATEADVQSYVATPLTQAITKPSLEAAVKICHDNSARIQMKMHEYFRLKGYVCPTDSLDCAFQWTFDTEISYFEHIHNDAERMKDFNTFMSGNRVNRKHWIDWFPVEAEIFSGSSGTTEDVLLVDVGGSKGHDLERFLGKYPTSKGRLVLQDLPGVLEHVKGLNEGIRTMSHDFFTPQPIKGKRTYTLNGRSLLIFLGARVYYTHFVLHDWPDDKCRDILRHLMTAMTPGYSKILLDESVLPDMGCPSSLAAGDINMMSIMAGKERSRRQWLELLHSVGLRLIRVWISPDSGDAEGIIEAMLSA